MDERLTLFCYLGRSKFSKFLLRRFTPSDWALLTLMLPVHPGNARPERSNYSAGNLLRRTGVRLNRSGYDKELVIGRPREEINVWVWAAQWQNTVIIVVSLLSTGNQ